MKTPRICKVSVAFAIDGSVIANVHNYAGDTDPEALLRRAIELGGAVFIGVVLRDRDARDVLSRVDEAGLEGAGTALVDRGRKARKKADKGASKKR